MKIINANIKNKVRPSRWVTGIFILALALGGARIARAQAQAQPAQPAQVARAAQPQNWEPTIAAFEQQDREHPVAPGGIVFTGSSSIVRWKTLAEDMAPLPVINRGFGGSVYTDVNQYALRTVVAYKPKIVVVYAGDNDLAAGSKKTPQSVAADVDTFIDIVHGKLPQAWIYVLSIKPSYLRWAQWPQMKEANDLIQQSVRLKDRVQYIDVATPLFEGQDKPSRDLFVEDGLHMTPKGYAIWTPIVKAVLVKRFTSDSTAAVPARAFLQAAMFPEGVTARP